MNNTYCYLHLRGAGRDGAALKDELKNRVFGEWRQAGITVWGIWEGIFGVASNELLVVAAASGERPEHEFTRALAGAGAATTVVEALLLAATVRPTGMAPCEKPGLYVFRFFSVRNGDVDEVARLSAEAWQTFEHTERYQTEPQGLFRQQDLSLESGRMLLVTWYDGLDSWQSSRQPAAAAVENFRRRRALTQGTWALATRLVAPFGD